jgi:hypothetical protein
MLSDRKNILSVMADVNLSFLHGMALESAKLAVNYVRGTGDGGDDESAAVVTGASVQNMSLSNVTAVSLLPRFLEPTGSTIPKTYRIHTELVWIRIHLWIRVRVPPIHLFYLSVQLAKFY